ncbi:hypothetical protein B0H14DRAFT_2612614 [Mycena olivaceomarginata]|nr:hypothetical protein B0H14DRAFT_2612614 [Mycena olivaceomarginata]
MTTHPSRRRPLFGCTLRSFDAVHPYFGQPSRPRRVQPYHWKWKVYDLVRYQRDYWDDSHVGGPHRILRHKTHARDALEHSSAATVCGNAHASGERSAMASKANASGGNSATANMARGHGEKIAANGKPSAPPEQDSNTGTYSSGISGVLRRPRYITAIFQWFLASFGSHRATCTTASCISKSVSFRRPIDSVRNQIGRSLSPSSIGPELAFGTRKSPYGPGQETPYLTAAIILFDTTRSTAASLRRQETALAN